MQLFASVSLTTLLLPQRPTAIWQFDSWTQNLGGQWVRLCAAKCWRFQREEQRGSCCGVTAGSRGSARGAPPSDLLRRHLASPAAALQRCALSIIPLLAWAPM